MRKRSKYRPKGIIANPVAYVLESLVPVAKHESYLLDLKIKNSDAMRCLLRGEATRMDLDTLIAMSNITEALYQLGFGREYGEVCVGGREALIGIAHRAVQHGRFVPTGPEIAKLNLLMDLHDAQMDVITIKDMERALAYAKSQFTSKKNVTYLPSVKELT
jgi:hypothetical protein